MIIIGSAWDRWWKLRVIPPTWKRSLTKKAVVVTARPLERFRAADRRCAEAALQPFADFVELPLEVRWP